jgi:hypothetical protein
LKSTHPNNNVQREINGIPNANLKKQIKYIPKLDFIVYNDGSRGEVSGELYNIQTYEK